MIFFVNLAFNILVNLKVIFKPKAPVTGSVLIILKNNGYLQNGPYDK